MSLVLLFVWFVLVLVSGTRLGRRAAQLSPPARRRAVLTWGAGIGIVFGGILWLSDRGPGSLFDAVRGTAAAGPAIESAFGNAIVGLACGFMLALIVLEGIRRMETNRSRD